MTGSNSIAPEGTSPKALPRRDWILLPLLSLLTICLLAGSAELIARRIYPRGSSTAGEDCMVDQETLAGKGGIPNSVCWERRPEGKLTRYRFNSSGYRSDVEFGPKSPGTYRIVLIGSSFAVGARVPIEEAFSTRLPVELTQRTGHKVELFNEGLAGPGGRAEVVVRRLDDALAAKPNLILWALTPWDIGHLSVPPPQAVNREQQPDLKAALAKRSALGTLLALKDALLVRKPVFALWLQHLFYESQTQYVKSYLQGGDGDRGYLAAEPSQQWKSYLAQFDSYDAEIEARARAAGVPLVVTLIPLRVQTAMIAMGSWPPGYDPYKLDNDLRSIVQKHGGIYLDILPNYRKIPNPEQDYFAVEGHLNGDGHAIVSALLAQQLTSGVVSALSTSPSLGQDR